MNEHDRQDELEAQIRAALARKRPQQPAPKPASPPQPVIVSAGLVKPATAGQPAAAARPAPQPAAEAAPRPAPVAPSTPQPAARPTSQPAAQPAPGGMVIDPAERLASPTPGQPPQQLRARFVAPDLAPAQPAAPVARPEPSAAAPAAPAVAPAIDDGRRALSALLARSAIQAETTETQIPPPPGQVLGRIGVEQQPAPAGTPAAKEKPFRHPYFSGKRHLWPMLVIPALSIGVVLVLFYFLKFEIGGAGVVDIAPLIEAEQTPLKVRPAEEGGLEIPNQDMEFFGEIDGETASAPAAEQLVPEPEQPVVPESAETAAATTGEATTGTEPAAPVVPAPSLDAETDAATPTAETTGATATDTTTTGTAESDPTATEAAATTGTEATTETTETATEPQPEPVTETAALPAGAFRIQLAAVRSEDGARATWQELQAKLPELSVLQLHIERIDLGSNGIFYRVQAGPLADQTAAYNLCADLGSRGQDCLVVKP